MSFFRSVLLVSTISLLAAFVLLILGSLMGYEEFKGGYAVLTTDAEIDDRSLRSILETNDSYFGGALVSESSQWVMLDEFDAVRAIPLDQYSSRVFPFDPRNDGYADKLRNVFIRDGKRFVYIPLRAGNWNSSHLDKQFSDLLDDITYSVNYYGIERPLYFFFIIYGASSLAMLIISYVKAKSIRGIGNIIVLIPVLSALSFFGAVGIGAAALFFGLFILLKEPLNELVNPVGSRPKEKSAFFKRLYKEIILPYRLFWAFLPLFASAFAVLVIFSQLKFSFLISVFAASSFVFFVSLKVPSLSIDNHRRFTPVMIMRKQLPEFNFSLYMLPFVLGAFVIMFFASNMSASYSANGKFDSLIEEHDYYEHLAYQASFSTRQLGTSSAAFPDFSFDKDGLPSINTMSVSQKINLSEFPPFPLKRLMEFFHDVNNSKRTNTSGSLGGIAEKLSLLVLLLFLLPPLFIKRKDDPSSKIDLSGLRRVSEKLRLPGINLNKSLVYNNRKTKRDRKDA
ncbi:MAG: hypothetical protein LBI28_13995 [Treponema sp.]|jgi:hypothetical protein|nr:hypothetical protein [Treponema sp.]